MKEKAKKEQNVEVWERESERRRGGGGLDKKLLCRRYQLSKKFRSRRHKKLFLISIEGELF